MNKQYKIVWKLYRKLRMKCRKEILGVKKIGPYNVLDIQSLEKIHEKSINFNSKSGNDLFLKEYVDSLKQFFDWYLLIVDSILNGKVYNDSSLCDFVFKSEYKSSLEEKNALKMHLYVSKLYVAFLNKTISVQNIVSIHEKIQYTLCDLEGLLIDFHIIFEKEDSIHPLCGRQGEFNLVALRDCAYELFFIGNQRLDSLTANNLSFYSIFAIRQLIELWGKRILGYGLIYDENGIPIKKFTQIGWDFIAEQNKKGNIKLPFSLDKLMRIFTWSNIFTHLSRLYAPYMQYYAINMVNQMFVCSDRKMKIIYNGSQQIKACADILIYNYGSVKADFEKMLQEKNFGRPVKIDWINVDNNEAAYIMSL